MVMRAILPMLLALCAIVAAPAREGAAPDPTELVLSERFEARALGDEAPLFYKDTPEQRFGEMVFHGGEVASGQGAVTLRATPSCGADAPHCSERAELWEKPELLGRYDRTLWYGLSLNLDDPLPQDDGRYVIAQWKREVGTGGLANDFSPFLALRLYRGRIGFTVETDRLHAIPIGGEERPDGCLPGEALVLDRPEAGQTRALVAIEEGTTRVNYPDYFDACAPSLRVERRGDLPVAQRGWIDIAVRSSPGPQGRIEIFANGRAVATVTGPVGFEGPGWGERQYFKFGVYRAPNPVAWSVTFDDFRRGPRCADVMRGGVCPD